MQRSNVEWQRNGQQRQLAQDQTDLQTQTMNADLQNLDLFSAEESNNSTDDNLYKIRNTLAENVYQAQSE